MKYQQYDVLHLNLTFSVSNYQGVPGPNVNPLTRSEEVKRRNESLKLNYLTLNQDQVQRHSISISYSL